MSELVRYRNLIYDSARWDGFPFRPDDVVISTPPKCGTTWMQSLCAMLVLDSVEFDRPLSEVSPWIDMQTNDLGEVVASLEAQRHRRVIKTHTPLDGLPAPEGVTFICVGRDPRDVALSFQHHWSNMDLDAVMAARAGAVGLEDLPELPPLLDLPDDPAAHFRLWMDAEPGTFVGPGLEDVLHHIDTFWQRRGQPDVELFHYSDLLADLPAQLRRLADVLGIELEPEQIDRVVVAAAFGAMKARADDFVPDAANHIWRSNQDFFHRGVDGQWRDLLEDADLVHYEQRVAELVAPEVAAWAHGGWSGSPRAEGAAAGSA